MKTRFILTLFILLSCSFQALSQKVVEKYPNGEKKYQGKLENGTKIGTHKYWFENGEKWKIEKYSENGVLIRNREWNKEGELIKDEKPEELMQKMRVEQFEQINWLSLPEGAFIYKMKGENRAKSVINFKDYVVHYAVYLENGREIESSVYSNSPISVNLDNNDLIDGFPIGLKHFDQGDNGFIKIPYRLAYGEEGTRDIPAFATVIFQVIVLKAQ